MNKVAWAIAIGSAIPQGIVIAWTAMMVVNLTQVAFAVKQWWRKRIADPLIFLIRIRSLIIPPIMQINLD